MKTLKIQLKDETILSINNVEEYSWGRKYFYFSVDINKNSVILSPSNKIPMNIIVNIFSKEENKTDFTKVTIPKSIRITL